jgi:uncharacterized protein (DUF3084 family)
MNTTQIRYQRRRLADLTAALRLARAQMSHEHGPRAELGRHQQQRLEVVVRHAAAHSPFYRRQFAETGALGDSRSNCRDCPCSTNRSSWSTSTTWSATPGCDATSCSIGWGG